MSNAHILSRISGIRQQLLGAYQASSSSSSATKGGEREFFIDLFLSQVLPLPFRFGTGDATDQYGHRSGQLDVVVEYPFLPSLPIAGGSRYRLYLAESIAAVIEVKSDVAAQWVDVQRTAQQLHAVRPNFITYSRDVFGGNYTQTSSGVASVSGMVVDGSTIRNPGGFAISIDGRTGTTSIGDVDVNVGRVPIFAVGYKGWKTIETLIEHLEEGDVDGILVLDPPLFVSKSVKIQGDTALWAFICSLDNATKQISQISSNPLAYIE